MKKLNFYLGVFALAGLFNTRALAIPALGFPNNPGLGASRVARSTSLGSLTVTGVYPRIFTPNGDGYNDKVGFHFDNPELLPVTGEVFDITGARVADLREGTDPASLLLWDGKDADGRVVPGGIYIYQITFQGKQTNGTVVVAR
jgi:hypothetical protein